ncbi:MAG: hypothetical protein QOK06_664 [Acidimicrobiaceae bacterium]
MSWMIRSPRPHELGSLREIETAAGALFAGVGLSDVAAHEPFSIEELTAYLVVERTNFGCETV